MDKRKTETEGIAAIRWLKTVSARGTTFFRLVAIAPATGHTELTFCLSFEKLGIGGIFPFVPVAAPFVDIAVHVIQPPGICFFLPDGKAGVVVTVIPSDLSKIGTFSPSDS